MYEVWITPINRNPKLHGRRVPPLGVPRQAFRGAPSTLLPENVSFVSSGFTARESSRSCHLFVIKRPPLCSAAEVRIPTGARVIELASDARV